MQAVGPNCGWRAGAGVQRIEADGYRMDGMQAMVRNCGREGGHNRLGTTYG